MEHNRLERAFSIQKELNNAEKQRTRTLHIIEHAAKIDTLTTSVTIDRVSTYLDLPTEALDTFIHFTLAHWTKEVAELKADLANELNIQSLGLSSSE